MPKYIPYCSVLLCKTGSQHACVTAVAPTDICSSYRCAVTQHQRSSIQGKMHSLLFSPALQNRFALGKMHSHCSVLLCKTALQHACVTAVTPVNICSSYRCAVTQHQCTRALFKATCIPGVQCCSVKQPYSIPVSLQKQLWRFAFHTGVQ